MSEHCVDFGPDSYYYYYQEQCPDDLTGCHPSGDSLLCDSYKSKSFYKGAKQFTVVSACSSLGKSNDPCCQKSKSAASSVLTEKSGGCSCSRSSCRNTNAIARCKKPIICTCMCNYKKPRKAKKYIYPERCKLVEVLDATSSVTSLVSEVECPLCCSCENAALQCRKSEDQTCNSEAEFVNRICNTCSPFKEDGTCNTCATDGNLSEERTCNTCAPSKENRKCNTCASDANLAEGACNTYAPSKENRKCNTCAPDENLAEGTCNTYAPPKENRKCNTCASDANLAEVTCNTYAPTKESRKCNTCAPDANLAQDRTCNTCTPTVENRKCNTCAPSKVTRTCTTITPAECTKTANRRSNTCTPAKETRVCNTCSTVGNKTCGTNVSDMEDRTCNMFVSADNIKMEDKCPCKDTQKDVKINLDIKLRRKKKKKCESIESCKPAAKPDACNGNKNPRQEEKKCNCKITQPVIIFNKPAEKRKNLFDFIKSIVSSEDEVADKKTCGSCEKDKPECLCSNNSKQRDHSSKKICGKPTVEKCLSKYASRCSYKRLKCTRCPKLPKIEEHCPRLSSPSDPADQTKSPKCCNDGQQSSLDSSPVEGFKNGSKRSSSARSSLMEEEQQDALRRSSVKQTGESRTQPSCCNNYQSNGESLTVEGKSIELESNRSFRDTVDYSTYERNSTANKIDIGNVFLNGVSPENSPRASLDSNSPPRTSDAFERSRRNTERSRRSTGGSIFSRDPRLTLAGNRRISEKNHRRSSYKRKSYKESIEIEVPENRRNSFVDRLSRNLNNERASDDMPRKSSYTRKSYKETSEIIPEDNRSSFVDRLSVDLNEERISDDMTQDAMPRKSSYTRKSYKETSEIFPEHNRSLFVDRLSVDSNEARISADMTPNVMPRKSSYARKSFNRTSEMIPENRSTLISRLSTNLNEERISDDMSQEIMPTRSSYTRKSFKETSEIIPESNRSSFDDRLSRNLNEERISEDMSQEVMPSRSTYTRKSFKETSEIIPENKRRSFTDRSSIELHEERISEDVSEEVIPRKSSYSRKQSNNEKLRQKRLNTLFLNSDENSPFNSVYQTINYVFLNCKTQLPIDAFQYKSKKKLTTIIGCNEVKISLIAKVNILETMLFPACPRKKNQVTINEIKCNSGEIESTPSKSKCTIDPIFAEGEVESVKNILGIIKQFEEYKKQEQISCNRLRKRKFHCRRIPVLYETLPKENPENRKSNCFIVLKLFLQRYNGIVEIFVSLIYIVYFGILLCNVV